MVVQQSIEQALSAAFQLEFLEVENESHKHSVPPNSETHFKVVLVSDDFSGVRKVARHQQVYSTLSTQIESGVHALAIHTYTIDEWNTVNSTPSSPNCMGGGK